MPDNRLAEERKTCKHKYGRINHHKNRLHTKHKKIDRCGEGGTTTVFFTALTQQSGEGK